MKKKLEPVARYAAGILILFLGICLSPILGFVLACLLCGGNIAEGTLLVDLRYWPLDKRFWAKERMKTCQVGLHKFNNWSKKYRRIGDDNVYQWRQCGHCHLIKERNIRK